jgi:hypothetical protein
MIKSVAIKIKNKRFLRWLPKKIRKTDFWETVFERFKKWIWDTCTVILG